ncbi:MAG TPA: 2-oxoacid:acceptor oxidoreductase subunit alpha [Myxococcota bacterium]|nr:2-oxoacid:acceptor oxidoreductase subunit alpha [Myxococcota bacterium]HRY96525.1 2-oxoacid:acceptor oxidoreductase subunit alpha [Myxococcota bacterium]HSA24749.1 2-oxoacid:acceptor oxidoreductase subunit alpha [Myxococcota bacterium]
MKADPRGVLTGVHFLDGDHACCEGALAAGCRCAFGYPITPSTEVVERIAQRLPTVGGVFLQMEDEIASSIAIQGAAWGGKKVLSVSSGPGISLMMEHIGLAAMTETPCVFVNVQRAGPSTGLPTLVAQADMMQARWGSHGDYEVIAICPNSPQECFDLTLHAFNLAETYRTPVMFMMDEAVGHMTERVVIPAAEQLEVVERRRPREKPSDQYALYRCEPGSRVPPMPPVGEGYRFHVTGLTHDERGYPVMNAEAQDKLVRRLVDKIRLAEPELARYEEFQVDDADVVLVAYGITSRVVQRSMRLARERGLKVGVFRPVVVWPFPERRLRELARRVKAFVVAELNLGQVVLEVERLAGGTRTVLASHAGGALHEPEAILKVVQEVLR